jgi:hypothetical protein
MQHFKHVGTLVPIGKPLEFWVLITGTQLYFPNIQALIQLDTLDIVLGALKT